MAERRAELLAPAGSFETMKAVIAAGADAVYMGGPKFGARAYADNADEDTYLEAIDYAHLRGKKLYMTVNTLLKERELESELYDYLLPFYKRGLDAVIVQDLGVFEFVREAFPDMPVHISTQMTVTGAEAAEFFKAKGASRVVTARELNLKELKEISRTGIEVESFVHGAICYCYSGKCLFSSLAGGRSGNRGRCAQPCRQAYDVYTDKKLDNKINNKINIGKEKYVLSLKDMNTLDILPEILDAGVYSLKIEGRMKKAEYAAGVVSIYRKYLDLALDGINYTVSKEDKDRLFDLFNRNGFSEGYYKQYNGKNMMSLTEVDFRSHDLAYQSELREKYIDNEVKSPVSMSIYIKKGQKSICCVYDDECSFVASFEEPMEANSKPISKEQIVKQFSKMGATDFAIEEISIELDDNVFLPVSMMNSMRREALNIFREQKLSSYLRNKENRPENKKNEYRANKIISASVQTIEQFEAVLKSDINRIYYEAVYFEKKDISSVINKCKAMGKEIYYVFGDPLRSEEEKQSLDKLELIKSFDGLLCDSIESLCFAKKHFPDMSLVAGQALYSWNKEALASLLNYCERVTAPFELNIRELSERGMSGTELIVYGYQPMMVTAGCLYKNTKGCVKKDGKPSVTGSICDGAKRKFPFKTACYNCGNVIYNCVPQVLFDTDLVKRINPASVRFSFTVESGREVETILEKAKRGENLMDFTRGHIKRGVE